MQRRIRQLRRKYNIPMRELVGHSEVSVQRLSQIELSEMPVTDHMNRLMEFALHRYLLQKRAELSRLEADFATYRKCLLDFVDEGGESL